MFYFERKRTLCLSFVCSFIPSISSQGMKPRDKPEALDISPTPPPGQRPCHLWSSKIPPIISFIRMGFVPDGWQRWRRAGSHRNTTFPSAVTSHALHCRSKGITSSWLEKVNNQQEYSLSVSVAMSLVYRGIVFLLGFSVCFAYCFPLLSGRGGLCIMGSWQSGPTCRYGAPE